MDEYWYYMDPNQFTIQNVTNELVNSAITFINGYGLNPIYAPLYALLGHQGNWFVSAQNQRIIPWHMLFDHIEC